MLTYFFCIGGPAIVLAGLVVLAFAGFRNGDFSGEALARALRADLEAAASETGEDRVPPG
jgi:hypothetical protein